VVHKNSKNAEHNFVVSYITNATIIFSIGWLFLFSSSRWVEINQFSWRYFSYVFFALIFLFTVHLSHFINKLNAKKSLALTSVGAIATILFLILPVPKLNFNDYGVFQRVNALTEPGGHLYSGDYWVVWPSVLRDMMNGFEAYGLTYRGEANKEAAREYVLRKIRKNGHATVYCLNETDQNCTSQINSVVGPLYAIGSTPLRDGVRLIDFVEYASYLDLKGTEFLNLPTQVGIIENSAKITQSRSGFLVYGPYVPFKSGRYLLSVFGISSQIRGAYVEVVSDKGAKIHAKFGLAEGRDIYLIRNVEVVLLENINDLEVRVWVGEEDQIKLYGYSLTDVTSGS
jgi:hypothetical protein